MSAPSPLVVALIDALAADPAALDQLAAALAPRLAAVEPVGSNAPLTTAQAAQRAGVHERTIRRALAAGTLEGYTVAGRWRIDAETLNAWLRVGAPTSTPSTNGNGRLHRGVTKGGDAIAGTNGRAA